MRYGVLQRCDSLHTISLRSTGVLLINWLVTVGLRNYLCWGSQINDINKPYCRLLKMRFKKKKQKKNNPLNKINIPFEVTNGILITPADSAQQHSLPDNCLNFSFESFSWHYCAGHSLHGSHFWRTEGGDVSCRQGCGTFKGFQVSNSWMPHIYG